MRPLISWADLAGRRVGVWGPAGVEGQANLRTLAALGVAPAVLVDDSPAGAGHGPAVLATADGGLEALASCDVVIKAPGISRYRDDARFLVDRGVAICGSGVGASVCANKVPGIRAALIHDHFSARQGVEDDHLNILCMGGRTVGPAVAWDLLQTFLAAKFSQAERDLRRLGKVASQEAEQKASLER